VNESIGRYVSCKHAEASCETKETGPDGTAGECDRQPVWQFQHSSGRTLHICEYHIECNRNFWPAFREAVQDIWPVKPAKE
jgi:hypothetical protein